MKNTILVLFIIFISSACNSKQKNKEVSSSEDVILHKVQIEEVIQTTNYTYLFVAEEKNKFWIAVTKDDLNPGASLFYFNNKITTMVNFHSKELNRDFDKILFIGNYSKENSKNVVNTPVHANQMPSNKAHSGRKKAEVVDNITIEKAEGGITIEELYRDKASFKNKTVKISGVVMKVNLQIMGRNWVHVQDGTNFGDEYDLTITTQDTMTLGQRLILEGRVTLDKDFSSGYFYPVIVEEATIVTILK